jgi:hypothetical protein
MSIGDKTEGGPILYFARVLGWSRIFRSSGEKIGCLVVVGEKVSLSIAITTFGARCLVSGGISTISKNTDSNYLVH